MPSVDVVPRDTQDHRWYFQEYNRFIKEAGEIRVYVQDIDMVKRRLVTYPL
jgi:hypothetical protein